MNKQMKMIIQSAAILFFIAFMTSFSLKVNAEEIKLSAPSNLKATTDYNRECINLTWDAVDGAENYIIYRSLTGQNDYVYYDESDYLTEYEDEVKVGVTYYYKIVAYAEQYVEEEYGNSVEVYGEPAYSGRVQIPFNQVNISSVASSKSHTMTIKWSSVEHATGYFVYRSTNPNTNFTYIGSCANAYHTISFDFDDWNWWEYVSHEQLIVFTDKGLTVGTTYYYKVCPYVTYEGRNFTGALSAAKGDISRIDAPVIKKAVSKKKKTNKITWSKVSGADGYYIYCAKSPTGKFKKIKTIKNKKTVSYTHKKLKNGVAYYYKVYAYKKIKGKAVASNDPEVYEKYCDYFTYAAEPYESRYKRVYGAKGKYKYNTSKNASKHMKTISVKVWDVNAKGKKYTRTFRITVNKGIAPSVKEMFKEIYKSKERFPIHDIGCYSWRGNSSTSEHCLGLAFDINSNENYMIEGKKILAGSLWNPKKNKYSIPLNCKLVSILEKYGFTRGFWGSRKDYMHFSYFGT